MFNENNFGAIAGATVFIGGFAWFLWQAIKETEPRPRRSEPIKKARTAAPKPTEKAVKQPARPQINPETLKAMHKQADAERAIAEALERKMLHTPDPIKHARLEKQAANSWLRFNKILDQIDKLTMQ